MTDDLTAALRARRAALGGSVTLLAAELGVTPAQVSQWFARPPDSPLARALARTLSRSEP